MQLVAALLVGLVAVEHLYIMWIEMFAWTTAGRKAFRSFPAHLFEPTKGLAANQGLYNGFLAAGLIWSLCIGDLHWRTQVATFFLSCVGIAGLFGAVTAARRIFYVQALPAIIALICVWIAAGW
ncbi:DUF1304 domain-containing protein [Chitinophaga parva]|uniref:DUF1304 domain-containing protein n=1 Tax=Chitinophaga parva TaxID=2169414 RepID=A0A2T7BHJ3_9BACT|nr:DUF1304 domain-containing protein [Chitinophaga parva]PUZ25738.1 DUF1304 domain-containing protein [Chitinophaga parva]